MKSSAPPTSLCRASFAAVVAVAMLLPAAGCHKTPLLAPTDSVITLSINPPVLPLNGTAEIIATVIEQGGTAVQNGTLVIFTTSLGAIDPREARTSNGIVTVRLNAGTQSGVATVSAVSGNAVTTLEDAVQIGGAAVANLVLSANPSVVRSTGGTVQIVALVTDENGNRIPGVPVTFTTDAGRLADTVVPTNLSGEARVTLTTTQDATVTASVGGQTATVDVTVTDGPLLTLSVSADPTAGEPTVFTVNVTAGSNPVRAVRVQFGDGSAQALGALGDGATTVSHVYRRGGTFLVTLTATDVVGERTSITTPVVVTAQTPLSVTFDAVTAPTTGPPVAVSFSVDVAPSDVPIRRYDWTFGDGTSLSTSGSSTSHVYTSSGTETVRVTAVAVDGRTARAQIQIVIPEATPLSITLATPTTGTAPVSVTFSATVAPTGIAIGSYDWTFGDGASASTSGASTSHVYSSAATVTVTVTANATNGQTATAQIQIVIQ